MTDSELEYLMPWSFPRFREKFKRDIHGLPRIAGARREHGIRAQDGERFKLVFESANSDMAQGVRLVTDGSLRIDAAVYKNAATVFFAAPQPVDFEAGPRFRHGGEIRNSNGRELMLECRTREGMMWVWNVWEYVSQGARIVLSHSMYSGMLVEELPNGYRYRCNEGLDDDDYNDLVFRIERTGEIEPPRGSTTMKSKKHREDPSS